MPERRKLSKQNVANSKGRDLTDRTRVPFVVSFKYKLLNGYKFSDMQQKDLKAFQRFLDKVSDMTFNDVDRMYRRKSDNQDEYDGKDVIHYDCGGSFRIHGIVEDSRFKVLRIDPNHKFHN